MKFKISLRTNKGLNYEVVCNNKRFQDILKEFTKAKIGVKLVTGGEKTIAVDTISNGKKLLRVFRTKGKKVKHVYHVFRFNEEGDFKSIKPSEVLQYNSVRNFLKDQYLGKESKNNGVNYNDFKPKGTKKRTAKPKKENNPKGTPYKKQKI